MRRAFLSGCKNRILYFGSWPRSSGGNQTCDCRSLHDDVCPWTSWIVHILVMNILDMDIVDVISVMNLITMDVVNIISALNKRVSYDEEIFFKI